MRVGIIGAGAIGTKRAMALGPEARLVAVADKDFLRSRRLAAHAEADALSPEVLVRRGDVDVVIVSTSHDALTPHAVAAIASGKHVLIEKPAGRQLEEVLALRRMHGTSDVTVRVGCNHRFHPAFQDLKHNHLGLLGDVMNIRARYGHGGRLGYEKEWRADPSLSGGGELIDQGIHLIDLCNWLAGPFSLEWGQISTQFWNMPVEDNALVVLRRQVSDPVARHAALHVSCTEWKNLFDFEVACRRGKYQVTGLGRSYGPERLLVYRMRDEMGPPELQSFEYGPEDTSWRAEWLGFLDAIAGKKSDNATLHDAYEAMHIVDGVYKLAKAPWRSR